MPTVSGDGARTVGDGEAVDRHDMSGVRDSHSQLSTNLIPVRRGRRWRVMMTAPNGSVRLFGRFYSEKRAREWIAAHAGRTDLAGGARKPL